MTRFEQNVNFDQMLREFVRIKSDEHSYAYTSGYLEVLVTSMFRSLPAADRQAIMRDIQRSLESVTA
jgi:hypothetical protein